MIVNAATRSFGGSDEGDSCLYLSNHLVRISTQWSISMFVYIDTASQVNSFVLCGIDSCESWCWSSSESFIKEGMV